MADGTIPFWAGKDVKAILYLDETEVAVDHVDAEVQAQGEKAQDPIGGEPRDRMQFIITHYDVKFTIMQQKDKVTAALVKHQAMLDAGTLPKSSAVGFIIRFQDGTRGGYELRNVTIDDWTWNISPGRTQRNKKTIPMRAQYFDPVPVT